VEKGKERTVQIEYEKEAAKHIQAQDKPTRQGLKTAIEKIAGWRC